jgi:hypothetical protein
MSYDLSVTVKAWPSDLRARWLDELRVIGVDVEGELDDVAAAMGWRPLIVEVTRTATIPWASAFRALGRFESGFELHGEPTRALFSAKTDDGNAVAVWCAATLAAVTGGKLEDPQCGITASAPRAIDILAKLMRDDDFVKSFCGPSTMAKLPPPAPIAVPAKIALDDSKPTRDYKASAHFEVGEQLAHPTFGEGVVEASEPGKVTVSFRGGRRVLAQSKAAPAEELKHPPRIDHSQPVPGTTPGRR